MDPVGRGCLKESKQIEQFRPGLGKPLRSSLFPSLRAASPSPGCHPSSPRFNVLYRQSGRNKGGHKQLGHCDPQGNAVDTTGSCQRLSAKAAMVGCIHRTNHRAR